MSGSCYSCGSGFSFFKKELGCKQCGYAFCKDCINSKKIAVPRHNNEKLKVCVKCFNILSGKAEAPTTANYSPPDAYKKRIAALESASDRKGTTSKEASPALSRANKTQYPSSMTAEDISIAERLEKLRKDRMPDPATLASQDEIQHRLSKLKGEGGPPPPSTADIAARTAKLQGKDPVSAAAKHHSDGVSGRGEVEDLMSQYMEEVELDNSYLDQPRQDEHSAAGGVDGTGSTDNGTDQQDELQALIGQVAHELEMDAERAVQDLMKDKEIAARLRAVKGLPQNTESADNGSDGRLAPENNDDESTDEETEEDSVKRIIQQALEEQKLDEAAQAAQLASKPSTGLALPPDKPRLEEFEQENPWCCICNEDASLRCGGCDDDLYCKRCWNEGHDRFDMADHTTKPYKQMKNTNS